MFMELHHRKSVSLLSMKYGKKYALMHSDRYAFDYMKTLVFLGQWLKLIFKGDLLGCQTDIEKKKKDLESKNKV